MANTLRFKRGLASGIPTALAGEPLFTTDTFDLYIGNGTTNTRFQKYIASGSTTQILRGDGSLYTFPLAISSPSNGQVLKYNGTSWVNDSDSGITGSGANGRVAFWTGTNTQSGSGNFIWDNTNSRLGIGAAPLYRLHVRPISNANFGVRNAADFNASFTGTAIGSFNDADNANTNLYLESSQLGLNLQSGQNVLIGGNTLIGSILSSGEKLQVTGTMKVTGASSFGGTLTYASPSPTGYNLAFRTTGITTGRAQLGLTNTSGDLYLGVEGSTAGQSLAGSAAYSSFIGTFTNNPFYLVTNSTIKATIDTSGNLGLGVTPSAWNTILPLQIRNAAFASYTDGSGPYAYMGSNWYFSSGDKYISSFAASLYVQNSGQHRWYNAPSGTAGNAITFTQAMTLDASGNLLVGGTSVYASTITSYGTATRSGGIGIRNSAGTGAGGIFTYAAGSGSGSTDILVESVGFMQFNAAGAERMRLTATNGNLHIGTFSADSGEKLQVTGTAKITGNATFGGIVQVPSSVANGFFRMAYSTASTDSRSWQINNDAYGYGDFAISQSTTQTGTTFSQKLIISNSNLTIGSVPGTGAGSLYAAGGFFNQNVQIVNTSIPLSLFMTGNNSGTNGGSAISVGTSGITNIAIGNRSALLGGSYDATSMIYWGNGGSLVFSNGVDRFTISSTGSATITGNLTVDTNTLFVDATNNRVGILTTSPSYSLDVNGTVRASNSVLVSGGTALQFINSASTTVNAIRPTGGGTSVMSTNSNGLHIAVGTEAAGDLILASNNTERIRLSSNGWFSHATATNPSSSVTDSYVQYSADVTAGNAAPHFRTENGAVIKLYQETTAVGNAIISLGGGNAVLDDTTFDGYTLRQLVRALRNQGILQ